LLQRLILLHGLFDGVFEESLALHLIVLLLLLDRMVALLLAELRIELDRLNFKPVDPLA